jgi:hypothetical protein
MTNRIDTLIQRATGFALAALVTSILFGAIDGLAGRDVNANALLARASTSAQST